VKVKRNKSAGTGHGTGYLQAKTTSKRTRVGGLGVEDGKPQRRKRHYFAAGQERQPLHPQTWERNSEGKSAAKHNRPTNRKSVRDQILSAKTAAEADSILASHLNAPGMSASQDTRGKWQAAARRVRLAQVRGERLS
jgi:hypothetical protein